MGDLALKNLFLVHFDILYSIKFTSQNISVYQTCRECKFVTLMGGDFAEASSIEGIIRKDFKL